MNLITVKIPDEELLHTIKYLHDLIEKEEDHAILSNIIKLHDRLKNAMTCQIEPERMEYLLRKMSL